LRNAFGFFALFALIVAALMLGIGFFAPQFLPDTQDRGQFVYLIILVTVISTGIFSTTKAQLGIAVRQGLIWAGIFMLLIALFTFRDDFSQIGQRMMAELQPSKALRVEVNDAGQNSQRSAVALSKAADGHFWAEGRVNNTHVRFMVDTGASSVALTLMDAKRAGINIDALRFNIPVSTASGQVYAARAMLDYLSIGQLRIDKVDALVMRDGLDTSLLGMSYLGRLSRFEATKNQLILRR
jgi:aspartyl protease family protein